MFFDIKIKDGLKYVVIKASNINEYNSLIQFNNNNQYFDPTIKNENLVNYLIKNLFVDLKNVNLFNKEQDFFNDYDENYLFIICEDVIVKNNKKKYKRDIFKLNKFYSR